VSGIFRTFVEGRAPAGDNCSDRPRGAVRASAWRSARRSVVQIRSPQALFSIRINSRTPERQRVGHLYKDELALARCSSRTKQEHRINWARISRQHVTTLHCVGNRWMEFLRTTSLWGLPEDETRIETKIQRAFPWSPHSNDDLRLFLRCLERRHHLFRVDETHELRSSSSEYLRGQGRGRARKSVQGAGGPRSRIESANSPSVWD